MSHGKCVYSNGFHDVANDEGRKCLLLYQIRMAARTWIRKIILVNGYYALFAPFNKKTNPHEYSGAVLFL